MRRLTPRLHALVVAVLLLPAGCGWVSVGYPTSPPPQPRPSAGPPPATPAPPPAAGRASDPAFVGASAVIVARGDTVYGLAKRHQVSPRGIIEANNLKAPYHLLIGQRIVLPRARIHVVQRGESLFGIARRNDVEPYAIARANELAPPYRLTPGQQLRIPGKGSVTPQGGDERTVSAALKPAAPRQAVTAKAPPKPKSVPQPPPTSGKGFVWPLRGPILSSYGAKRGGLFNDGINIAADRGAAVRAAEGGVVAYAGNELRGFGNMLLIKHQDGWVTAYAHNEVLLVKRGDRVQRGQVISRVGSTGGVRRPQLHFEMRKRNKAVNPEKHLTGQAGA